MTGIDEIDMVALIIVILLIHLAITTVVYKLIRIVVKRTNVLQRVFKNSNHSKKVKLAIWAILNLFFVFVLFYFFSQESIEEGVSFLSEYQPLLYVTVVLFFPFLYFIYNYKNRLAQKPNTEIMQYIISLNIVCIYLLFFISSLELIALNVNLKVGG